MWTNYLKIALRNLRRQPIYAGINIFGLAAGLAVCLLIVTFIWEQFQYDQFHEHKDRIVRIITDRSVEQAAGAPAPLGPLLEKTAPEVEETARLSALRGNLVRDRQATRTDGMFADSSFFEIFSFELARGNPATALTEPKSLVLTRPTAEKLFGEEDPVGKTVRVEDSFTTKAPYTVTGVLETPPGPTHLQFDVVASLSTLETLPEQRSRLDNWKLATSYPTYILLRERANPGDLADDLTRIANRRYEGGDPATQTQFETQPLTAITPGPHYGSRVSVITVPWFVIYFMGGLGGVLLMTACFNYVGLSVARALERATEIGVRKVVGARRRQLIGQFLAEAILFALGALALAYALLPWLVTLFNDLQFIGRFGGTITSRIYHPELLLLFVLVAVAAGGLAGGLPALRLSAFQPIRALKDARTVDVPGWGNLTLRKGLIVAQFAFAVVFIISAAQLYRQYHYMAGNDFGLETEQVINVRLQEVSYETFREELRRHPSIAGISAADNLPPEGGHMTELTREGRTLEAEQMMVGPRFIENMGLEIVAGRSFSPALGRDSTRLVVINKGAVRALGYETPADAVGASLSMDTNIVGVGTKDVEIIGVVQDYQFGPFTEPIGPLVLWYGTGNFWLANVRARPGQLGATEQAIEATWKKLDPVHPADYQRYAAQIAQRPLIQLFDSLARTVGVVAVLAIIIAGLGLLGLAAYAARTRVREVGIRKAVGASVPDVTLLLSKEILMLVAIGVVIALPAAWQINKLWLGQFARRVEFTGTLIGGSILAVLLIALFAVGSQTLKAALTNPAEALRYE